MHGTHGGRLAGLACALLALSLVSRCRRRSRPRWPRRSAPRSRLAEPSGGYVGRLSVSPEHGPAGTQAGGDRRGTARRSRNSNSSGAQSTGAGRSANAEYHGRDYQPIAYEIAKVKTTRSGRHRRDIRRAGGFRLHPRHRAAAGRPPVHAGRLQHRHDGEDFAEERPGRHADRGRGQGHRLAARSQNSWMLLYDNNFTGWMSAVTTGGSASFTIPATGEPGVHILEVLHGEFTFPYRNMQQSRSRTGRAWRSRSPSRPARRCCRRRREQQAQTKSAALPPQGDLVATPQFSGVGEPVVVRGEGFEPGKSHRLNWTTRDRQPHDRRRGWEESSTPSPRARRTAPAMPNSASTMPDDLGGAHGLWIESGTGEEERRRTGSSRPRFRSTSAAGRWARPSQVHLKGVGWTETANIYTVGLRQQLHRLCLRLQQPGRCRDLHQGDRRAWLAFHRSLSRHLQGQGDAAERTFVFRSSPMREDHPGEDLPAFPLRLRGDGPQYRRPSRGSVAGAPPFRANYPPRQGPWNASKKRTTLGAFQKGPAGREDTT